MGLTKSRGSYATLCIPDSIYGLTLAWVTSENSTMLLESDSSWLTVAGPYPMLPRLSAPVSGADCPCPWFHANSLLLASLLSSANCPPLGRVVNCPLPGRVVNSVSRPLPTSGHGEISGPRILCLVSRQNRQMNRLLWRETHIVLQSAERAKSPILQVIYFFFFSSSSSSSSLLLLLSSSSSSLLLLLFSLLLLLLSSLLLLLLSLLLLLLLLSLLLLFHVPASF